MANTNHETTAENNSFDLKKAVENAANEVLQNTDFTDIIKANVQAAIEKTIKNSFEYGALSTAINNKIEEYLVPYIESYDFAKLVPKLDNVLTEIVNKTELHDISVTLSHFKQLMTIPENKVMTLDDLFKAYCKYAAQHVETDGRDVIYDSGSPEYEGFDCCVDCNDISSHHSSYKKISVDFHCNAEFEFYETSSFNIVLSQWKDDAKKDEYDIRFDVQPTLSDLYNLSDFEIFLMTLARARVKITNVESLSDFVTPEKEPELTYQ